LPNKRLIPKICLFRRADELSAVVTKDYTRQRFIASPVSLAKIYQSQQVNELTVVAVDPQLSIDLSLLKTVEQISCQLSRPITFSGAITKLEDASNLYKAGVDKLAFSRAFFHKESFIDHIIDIYGSANVSAVIDYKNNEVFVSRGQTTTQLSIQSAIDLVSKRGCGEIWLQNIDRDGSGSGLDLEILSKIKSVKLPLILSCGVGRTSDIIKALQHDEVDGVSAANFFAAADQNIDQVHAQLRNSGVKI
jgi:imidazole glycerol-phosphate synthase subunit HisF